MQMIGHLKYFGKQIAVENSFLSCKNPLDCKMMMMNELIICTYAQLKVG